MKVLIVVFLLILPTTTFAQFEGDLIESDIVKIEYTQLDKISRSFNPLFGSSRGNIDLFLIELKNLTTNEKILGVEILIESSETEIISRTIGFSNIGSLWGASSRVTARNLSREGYVFLLKEDLEEIMSFLNKIIGATGEIQDNYKVFSLSLYDRIEFGMIYDSDWSFLISIDEASYQLDFENGMQVLSRLNSFRRFIDENS